MDGSRISHTLTHFVLPDSVGHTMSGTGGNSLSYGFLLDLPGCGGVVRAFSGTLLCVAFARRVLSGCLLVYTTLNQTRKKEKNVLHTHFGRLSDDWLPLAGMRRFRRIWHSCN